MLNRHPILVAIDRTTDPERAIDVARSVAKVRGADVHVVQVVPHRAVDFDGRLDVWPSESPDDLGITTDAQLASIVQSGDVDGVRVRKVTLQGTPEHVIPAYAQLHEATLLVVERDFGSSRFWRNIGVVEELARRSATPLLVLPKRRTRGWDESGPGRILTPVDFSMASAVAMRTAVNLARRHGARVTLLHALEDVPGHMVFSGSEAGDVVGRLPAQVEAVADRLRRKAAFFGAHDVDTEVPTGDPDGAIVDVATRGDVDLILMGISHRSWLDRMVFGSTLRRVLRRAPVPVLVVPVVAGGHTWPDEAVSDHRSSVRAESPFNRVAA